MAAAAASAHLTKIHVLAAEPAQHSECLRIHVLHATARLVDHRQKLLLYHAEIRQLGQCIVRKTEPHWKHLRLGIDVIQTTAHT